MSAPELIISVSGLRGVVGETLTPEVAMRYIAAFTAELPPGPIVVTRDGRANGQSLAEAVHAAVIGSGRLCLDGAAQATPTTGVLVRELEAAGGIQISASHNPADYNGIKLFNQQGRVIPAAEGKRVLDRYQAELGRPMGDPVALPQGAPDFALEIKDCLSTHLNAVISLVDRERIRSRRFRVVLDANHGAGSTLGRLVLTDLGCEFRILGESPDGLFSHPPEPTEFNLQETRQYAELFQADAVFCQDPDADRLAIIDERGRYIGEEKTLALCVEHVLRSGRRGPVVTNCSTSRMSEDIARKYGVPFFRSKVGEANVVDLMIEKDAAIGGEGNGGVIDPRVGYVRDSFVGMALVLGAMAAREMPVSALADELPQYAIHKTTIAVAGDRIPSALDALERHFRDATADRLDGLRLDWPSGAWLLVRPSNTEPIVRAIAEAATLEEAKSLCERAAEAITH